MDGFINIYKEAGRSSHDAVAAVRRLLRCREQKIKVGHTGTLDPMATGVLPICVGKATRLAEYLCDCDKSYRATVCLGLETDSYDADGAVVACHSAASVTEEQVQALLPPLIGELAQVPPMVSALKKDGQPLYKLARAGVEVEREARLVTIYDLRYLGGSFGGRTASFTMEVDCSRGTYIRSLAHDLGAALGVGGHLTALQRLAVGPFKVTEALTLADLEQLVAAGDYSFLLAPVVGIAHLPLVTVTAADLARLRHGLAVDYVGPEQAVCRVESAGGRLLGIGRVAAGLLKMKKVLVGSND